MLSTPAMVEAVAAMAVAVRIATRCSPTRITINCKRSDRGRIAVVIN